MVLIVEGRDRECYTYAYPRAALTVDIILIAVLKQSPYLLLIERGKPPFEGCFAFPGGFVNEDETLEWAAGRELKEETGFWIKNYNLEFKAFKPYSDPQRDPRGRTITMVYSTILHTDHLPEVCGGDDASKALWFPINELPSLAFDHKKIIQDFLNSYHPEKLQ
ncbi:MAG: NUDIX hydrolase [Bacteroidales bacterium]